MATYLASTKDAGHSTFLKNFGTFQVAHLSQTGATGEQVILEMLSEIQQVLTLGRMQRTRSLRSMLSYQAKEDPLSVIVRSLLEAKKTEPNLTIEPGDDLFALLLSLKPEAFNLFKNRVEFEEALAAACIICKYLI